ncbi:Type II secretory pathway, pullulanase PulA and related glycosidase [Blautia schinkii]|nr:Type II secretory pathway, pullulanase PulA and related glycosidase [Blautia schinkii]
MASQKMPRIERGYPLILGANQMINGFNFAVEVPENASASLLLYRRNSKLPTMEIPFTEDHRTGHVYCFLLPDFQAEDYEYNFVIDGKIYLDPCAYRIHGREHFGRPIDEDPHKIRCGFLPQKPYDWEGDRTPGISYRDLVLYKLHVRGYTKLQKEVGRNKGTFSGLVEMIPYWKELGINAIELMPAYEFMEVPMTAAGEGMISERRREGHVNYWGYIPGYYFAPKRSYCATKEPETEFRDFIKALHKAGIECIMEIYLPRQIMPLLGLRVIQFWKLFYHVDGFHLLGDGVPMDLILKDGLLASTKLMVTGFDPYAIYQGQAPQHRNLAEYNTGFLEDMRRFLKSDEDAVQGAAYRIKHNPDTHAVVNYMACQDGFTLNDMVTYNYKHNEANGENNDDGSSYNYSWNCGIEGPSRKLAVREVRERQMRNAFLLMLLSQGVPMIYGGDEIANSQAGNNNAYCQDNPVGWVDWKGLKKNEKLYRFVKEAIAFRKEHPILHMPGELKGSDYKTKGCPDISFHGERAWYSSYDNTCRLLGVMYCGAYAEKEDGTPDDNIYVAYNFHWEPREIALPNLPEGQHWKKAADTGDLEGDGFFREQEEEYEKTIEIGPRTIVVLLAK